MHLSINACTHAQTHTHTIARYINSAHIFLCMPAKLDLSSYDHGHGTPGPGHPRARAPWPLLLKPTMLILTKPSIGASMLRQPTVGSRQAITFPIMGQPC